MGVRDTIARALANRIKVFHSSPHDFDRPSLEHIGRGQGAASYSPGFYVAESPKVSGRGGEYWREFLDHPNIPDLDRTAAEYLAAAKFDRDAALIAVRRDAAAALKDPRFASPGARRSNAEEFDQISRLLESGKPIGPRTYEMEITTPRSSFLDWDKPLPQQNEAVKEAVDRYRLGEDVGSTGIVHDETPGSDIYNILANRVGRGQIADPRAARTSNPALTATELLREGGIPGVTYLDAVSRKHAREIENARTQLSLEKIQSGLDEINPSLGMPANAPRARGVEAWAEEVARLQQTPLTSNYSVWDTDKLEVLKKYGIAGAGSLPIGALAASDQYEVQQ